MTRPRVYLDWNASAPLRPEARAAMLRAMDEAGNPSSVHAEGRAARAIVERAREQVAALMGCDAGEVVFTSGATESLRLVIDNEWDFWFCSPIEHDAAYDPSASLVFDPIYDFGSKRDEVERVPLVKPNGEFHPWLVEGFHLRSRIRGTKSADASSAMLRNLAALLVVSKANSETGVIQPIEVGLRDFAGECGLTRRMVDLTQIVGRMSGPFCEGEFEYAAASAHKIGGPKGAGALVTRKGLGLGLPRKFRRNLGKGGGQEQRLRPGTENVIGIAGFGAAAEAAGRDLESGVWETVATLRDRLEDRLASTAKDLTVVGQEAPRLPNTSCLMVPGWAGETQVIQMDLAGFAVSAGSACASGKVEKASRVLRAMGFDEVSASSAIRVSLGPTTTEAEVMSFADAWEAAYKRRSAKAA